MFSHEKTPLRGSDHYVPYVFMNDRQAALRRKVKQYQCLICTSVVLTLSMMFVIMMMSYSDASIDSDVDQSGFLQRPLKKAALSAAGSNDDVVSPGENSLPLRMSLSDGNDINGKPNLILCNQSKYRTPDGACNNLVNPLWGSSNQPLKRFIPADYCDGISSPRCSINKFDLPSSYFITAKIKNSLHEGQAFKNDIDEITKLLWGEFIYQDIVEINEYGPPSLLNKATSFLDGSNIYGSNKIDQRKVRTFFNGELSTDKFNDNKYSAISVSKDSKCNNGSVDFYIFEKILVKQHNLIASKLKALNPHWNDEKLFLEARRIVVAEIQHVSYNEFLEYIVGKQIINVDLKPYKSGYSNKYNGAVDPSISDAFATAAFKSFFEKFSKTRLGFIDGRCDFYSIAHNIQRGRDHGLPGYIKWREFCGLPKPLNFEDLNQLLGENNTAIIQSLYMDVADIDLMVGIILETPIKDSIFGEVGLCLITDQFRRIMFGDRYWYEVNEAPQKFSEAQLTEIRKTTLSSLICEYLENNGQFINKNFSPECSISSRIDVAPWMEESPLTNSFMPSVTNKNPEWSKYMEPGLSSNQNLLGASDKSNVVKRSISFNVNSLNITAAYSNGTMIYEGKIQKPPMLFPLDRVVDPYGYTPSADIIFIGTIEGNQIVGSFSVPLKNTDGMSGKTEGLKVNFEGDISFKWGNTIELKGNNEYKCKVLFQSYAKLANQNTNEPTLSLKSAIKTETQNEICTIMLVGTFYQRPFYCPIFPWWCLDGKLFYWSGDSKIVFKSIINNNDILPSPNKGVLKSISLKQKTDNVIVDKLFASVTVVTGKISGSFDDNEVIDVFTGSPPMDINIDHIISPNAYDTSFELVWSGTPINDSSIKGTFSVPYYTNIGSASKKMFKANYTFDVIYKYGGSIGIIDPKRTYTCKVLFPTLKKASLQNTLSPMQTIKGKTPFGESCSIMLGGYFKQQAFVCNITPWWCSNEKIFHWNGEAELTFKYKYNASDSARDKPLYQPMMAYVKSNKNFVLSDPFQNQGYEGKSVHRLGGKVRKGWIQIKNSGFFQSSKTIWSGELPTVIEMPLFWKPQTIENQLDTSDVFGHEVIWSCSIFQNTIQGSFLFPQYVGHSTPPLVNWIKGSFSMELELEETLSLYNIVVPGLSYRSRVNFHDIHYPDFVPFSTPQKEGPAQDDVYLSTKAPLILLGKYSPNHNSFIWNGSFIIIFTKTPEDYRLF